MKQLFKQNEIPDTVFKIMGHDDLSLEIKNYAKMNNVPIITDNGLETILQFLKIKKPKRILEIGSAIGYWSIMVSKHTDARVVTIEREYAYYEKACAYISRSSIGHKIRIYQADALDFDTDKLKDEMFDVIFIDAAKSAYKRYFEKYEPFLVDNGLIISDNLLFHGHIFTESRELSSNLQDLTRKIKTFSEWLIKHPNYETIFLPLGDGIAFSYLKGGGKNG